LLLWLADVRMVLACRGRACIASSRRDQGGLGGRIVGL